MGTWARFLVGANLRIFGILASGRSLLQEGGDVGIWLDFVRDHVHVHVGHIVGDTWQAIATSAATTGRRSRRFAIFSHIVFA